MFGFRDSDKIRGSLSRRLVLPAGSPSWSGLLLPEPRRALNRHCRRGGPASCACPLPPYACRHQSIFSFEEDLDDGLPEMLDYCRNGLIKQLHFFS